MEKLNDLMVTPSKKTISDLECAISVLGGAYLLYDSFKKEKKSILEMAAAGFMLYRGIKGLQRNGTLGNIPLGKKLFGEPAKKPSGSNINIHTRMIVQRPVNEVYNFWRHLGNLPLFMDHLEGVTVLSDTHSEWKASLPGGMGTISWKAEIVSDEPHRHIGWRSLPGSAISNAGKVTFKDAGELGTLVHVVFSYSMPFGSMGTEIARLMNPVFEKLVRKDVLGFKRYMETGTPQRLQQETVAIYT
ncbi:cyclase/dehydrase [Flavobacterium album]|uniref:Cyclase/dehydrase n=1 Tax=Flavobacterium album TaxID=2175091 RepID=A0A2S1QXQ7_9FLAO|nr:SRPBCC family protein [Flavobacterium album]AWH85164.1 cyclase/dehydrase [Flavobacterium album]